MREKNKNQKVRQSNCSALLDYIPFSFLFPSPNPSSRHILNELCLASLLVSFRSCLDPEFGEEQKGKKKLDDLTVRN